MRQLQLPVHPRQWNMNASICSELRDAVNSDREALRREICSEHEKKRWRGQWAGELLLKLAEGGESRETSKALRVLVAGGAWVNYRDRVTHTPLIWAAVSGDMELVEALIVGAHLDLQTERGWAYTRRDGAGNTALVMASQQGHGDRSG